MDLSDTFRAVRERMARACARSGRDPSTVTLLAVTKGHGPEAIRAALAEGQVLFGENKVQEARIKIPQCPAQARWHMIGHLQSNKCRDAARLFEMVHSVDSPHLAEELNAACVKLGRTLPVLLEVNVAGESSKYGFKPDEVVALLPRLNELVKLEIHGLMTMAPWTQDPEKVRPCFKTLRDVRNRCQDVLGAPLPVLSMGMSGDFEVAIEEGSTMVRVGTALFGPRKYSNSRVEGDGP